MKNLEIQLSHFYKIILIAIFFIALVLRWLYLPQGAVSFAFDQARDGFIVNEMIKGDLKILGPSVSGVPGLYHGVLYYYIILPAYLVGKGNPVVVAYWLSFLSSFGTFVVYWLAKVMFKKFTPAILSALIFAFSFEATQYSNLLTNASMAMWFVPLIYVGLYLWIDKLSNLAPIITGLALGLSIQSEFACGYHILSILFWLVIYKEKITKKDLFMATLVFLISISTMIFSEIKFGYTGISGLRYILESKDGIVQAKELGDLLITALNQSGKTFAYTIFPVNVVFGGLIGFTMLFISLKSEPLVRKMLLTYLFVYIFALPFGGWNMRHLLVGIAPAVAIWVGKALSDFQKTNKMISVLVLLIILSTNLIKIISENKKGQTLFLFPDMILSTQIKIVDDTYSAVNYKTFSISTLTSPLFVNTVWSYLYNYYGFNKYGYLPYWIGRDQIGQLGNNLKKPSSEVKNHFFIIEPTYGIPELWVTYAKGDQNSMSELEVSKNYGQIVVEKRIIKNEY